jgi:hypothetical protein
VATAYTKDSWEFQPYHIERREHGAPVKYIIGRIWWRTVPDSRRAGSLEHLNTGYYAEAATSQRYHPIVFNKERCCWVELRWSTQEHYFEVARPAENDLNINIPLQDALPAEEQGHVDREATPESVPAQLSPELQLHSPTQPTTSKTSERVDTPSIIYEPEPIAVHSPEVDVLA